MDAQSLSRWFREVLGTGALVRVRDDPEPKHRTPFDAGWPSESKRWPTLWEGKLEGWPAHLLFLPTGVRADGETWLLVVDADLYKEGAEESLAELYALGLPRRAPTALTPSGGEHLFFLVREPIPSRPLPGFPGIDIKCVGGGVRVYEWEYGWSAEDVELPELPSSLLPIFRGEVHSRPTSEIARALEPREPSLVDRYAVDVLVRHAGAHGPRWTGRGYAITRPGKTKGISATVGVIFPGGTHVFTSSWPSVPSGSYTLGELCALLGVANPMLGRMRELEAAVPKYEGPKLGARVVPLSSVKPELVSWLWPGRIPLGRLTILEGDPSIGKSTIALTIAAIISCGGIFPDGGSVSPSTALVLTAEDNLADTVRPRLDAAGADLDRVHALTGEWIPDEESGRREVEISLPAHLWLLERTIDELDVRLVIVDVLAAYTRIRGDVYRDADMRAAILAPLAAMAERTGAAVLLLRHLTKAHGSNPLYAGGGSIAITGAARSMLLAAPHPEIDGLRVLASSKSNLSAVAKSLSYTLEAVEELGCARIVWKGETELSASSLLTTSSSGSEPSSTEADTDQVREMLDVSGGRMRSKDLEAWAELVGISRVRLFAARKELGVSARQEADEKGRNYWTVSLPSVSDPAYLDPEYLSSEIRRDLE